MAGWKPGGFASFTAIVYHTKVCLSSLFSEKHKKSRKRKIAGFFMSILNSQITEQR
jgi:hypothetical protein